MTKTRLPLVVEQGLRQARQERESVLMDFERDLNQQRAAREITTTCTRGCHHCCYFPMTCSLLEGVELYRYLALHGQWSTLLRDRCEEHAAKVWALAHPVWLLSRVPCPLLRNGTCLGHGGRPSDCRTLYSRGDPHYCHPHRLTAETPFVDRKLVQARCVEIDDRVLTKHRIVYVPLPISKALLLGEQLDKGEIELEEVGARLYADHQRATS